MGRADPAWLVSPHLLVAEATAVALASVGTPAEAHSWQASILDQVGAGDSSPGPRRLVLVLDGFDDPTRIIEVVRLVQTTDVRIVLITSFEVAAWWGELVQDERVDLATDVTSIARLAEVVGDFLAGRALLAPEGRERVRAAWLRDLERRSHVAALLATLSPQQAKVLELLASGRRVAEVGALLGVTRGTVRSHVKALRAKLGARSQLEAVAMLHLARDAAAGSGASTPGAGPSARSEQVEVARVVPRPRGVSDESGADTRR